MKKVHFIGIGGIGISALARHYLSQGWTVSGSNNSGSELIDALMSEGMNIKIGHDEKNVSDDVSKIIYTIAVTSENVELIKAKELVKSNLEKSEEVILMTYPEALGEMTANKNVIAVCGTHGKTTTTAMAYYALKNVGINVSMIVGSLIEVDGKKTNYVAGNNLENGRENNWMIIEACEYRRSFLNYNPNIILITNIDNDHLDYFKDMEDTKSAFQEFVDRAKTPPNPALSRGGTSAQSAIIIHEPEKFLNTKDEVQKVLADEIINEKEIGLQVPGVHNRKNAQLVVALGKFLKLDKNKIKEGLKNFKGTWRRQEYKGKFFDIDFYDDYAHHPTEIKATLQAFREKFPNKKIIAIFQPHLFSRTKLLFNDFVNSFSDADEVILFPIYQAREEFDTSINSDMLVEEIKKINKQYNKKVSLQTDFETCVEYLKTQDGSTVVITLGAGDIYDIYKYLK